MAADATGPGADDTAANPLSLVVDVGEAGAGDKEAQTQQQEEDDDEAAAGDDVESPMSPSILKPGVGPVVAKGSPRLSFADRGTQMAPLADIREYQ